MDSLVTLIKLQKMQVDEQRQVLARLQAHLEQIEQAITELEMRQTLEQVTVQENPDTALTYGDFVRWAVAKARDLARQRAATMSALDAARDKLTALYAEQKRYELAKAAQDAEERREEQKREMADMDEVGSVGFVRRRKD